MKIHLDLDCFFASCERVLDSSLCGKPIAVGGRSDEGIFDKNFTARRVYDKNSGAFVQNIFYQDKMKRDENFNSYFIDNDRGKIKIRGIITTSSYEARAFGLKTGMSIAESLRLCPHLVVLRPNHLLYHEFSHKLYEFLKLKIPIIEQYSIDEFFGDLSGWVKDEDLFKYCDDLKDEIYNVFGLPISIGIANSKWAAKLVTNSAKPFGVKEVKDEEWLGFIKGMPIEKFPGIAKRYAKRLRSRGIENLDEIKNAKKLFYSWKKPGIMLYNRVVNIDDEAIVPSHPRKSIGISRTFDPIKERDEIKRRVIILARNLSYTINRLKLNPTSYFVKIRYQDFQKQKFSITIARYFNESFFKNLITKIFMKIDIYKACNIVYIGIRVSNFMEYKYKSFDLLTYNKDTKLKRLGNCVNLLRDKYGIDIVKNASEI